MQPRLQIVGSHVTIYCLTAIFGALSTWWFYKLLLVFGGSCVLNPTSVGFVTFTDNSTNTTSYDVSSLEGPGVEYWTSSPFAKDLSTSTVDPNKTGAKNYVNVTAGVERSNVVTPNKSVNATGPRRTVLDILHTSWATEETCAITFYAPVLSVIFGVIWLVFFVMCPATGEKSIMGMEQPWRILIPAGLFSLVMVGASLHAAWTIKSGLANLCKHLYNATGSYQCTSAIDILATSPSSSIFGAKILITLSVWCFWSCAMCWVACALLVLARLVLAPDFVVRTVTVRLMDQGDDNVRTIRPSDADAAITLESLPLLVKAEITKPSTPSSSDETNQSIPSKNDELRTNNDSTDTTQFTTTKSV